ncbi:MAG: DUF1513 domain-containing protein [Pseudomonadota bacterium]
MPTRRAFFTSLAAASVCSGSTWAGIGNPVALSAAMAQDGSYMLVGLRDDGSVLFSIPLEGRGHAAAAHPFAAEAVAIARRPGNFAKVIDCSTGLVTQVLRTPRGYHFYGHGAYSTNGTFLFTTENEIETGQGRIGVWTRSGGYRRVGEFSSGGIGPHEIIRLPSGDLAIANGGIRTHPDTGREKLNLSEMRPNLSILSTEGRLLDQVEPPAAEHQNSLRHIAAMPDGRVVCGFQWQGDPYEAPGLVAIYQSESQLKATEIHDASHFQLDGYIGSVCVFDQGRRIAASAPRAGRAYIYDEAGKLSGHHKRRDVCGLAPGPSGQLLATDGDGHVQLYGDTHRIGLKAHPIAFDNHLVAIS